MILRSMTQKRLRVKHDLDALRWLYVRSSTSAIRRLVIHALAGLPSEYIENAYMVFRSHWEEIKYEKERLLMDCMVQTSEEDARKRWIPKNIPNIDRRIEPLLRLEKMFPPLRRRDSSGIFGGHKLDFTMGSFSDPLLITLSTYDEPDDDIQVHWPKYSMNEFAIAALHDNRLHHPAVWRHLYNKTYPRGLLYKAFSPWDDGLHPDKFFGPDFTSQMYFKFLTAIYTSERNHSISPACTLADTAVQVDKRNIITVLLSLLTKDRLNDSDSGERTLLFAIMRFSPSNLMALSQTLIHANVVSFWMSSASPNYRILRYLHLTELCIPFPSHFRSSTPKYSRR